VGRSQVALEERIGRLLRVMVAAAVAVVALGAVLYLVRHGAEPVSFSTFTPGPLDLRGPTRIVARAFTLDPAAVIQCGILILLLTPVARVILSAVTYARNRDLAYAGLTSLVLAVLLFSLFWRS
jgi:uncharacterized membrane protein